VSRGIGLARLAALSLDLHGASELPRRDPALHRSLERIPLYAVVCSKLETYLARAQERERVVPRFVERELRASCAAASSVRNRVATGPRAGQRIARLGDRVDADAVERFEGERSARVAGLSLHADVSVPAAQRAGSSIQAGNPHSVASGSEMMISESVRASRLRTISTSRPRSG
jgi:hypothetical protein